MSNCRIVGNVMLRLIRVVKDNEPDHESLVIIAYAKTHSGMLHC